MEVQSLDYSPTKHEVTTNLAEVIFGSQDSRIAFIMLPQAQSSALSKYHKPWGMFAKKPSICLTAMHSPNLKAQCLGIYPPRLSFKRLSDAAPIRHASLPL